MGSSSSYSGDTKSDLVNLNKLFVMTTIKGIYENGQIKLLGIPPVTTPHKVLITFIDDEDDVLHEISLNQSTDEFKSYLQDSGEDLYQEYLKK